MCATRRHIVRGRLWTQVWVAIVFILVATVMAAAVGVRILNPEWQSKRGEVPESFVGAAEVIAGSLPEEREALPSALQETGRKLELRLGLYESSGATIATMDADIPAPKPDLTEPDWIKTDEGPLLYAPLEDGRVLVGGPNWGNRYASHSQLRHLALLAGILFFLLLMSWPLSRRVTRRLERLQGGVDSLGSGDLSARVPVEGHDEVARLATSFNRAAERIEALIGAQRRMLASASHELRSPLARLRVALELVSDPEAVVTPERRVELLRQAGSDVQELDGLIEDLLLVGRLGADEDAAKRRVDLDLLVLTAEEAARYGVEVGGAPTPARADERALRRLVRNLLENAEKHAGGAVDVTVTPHAGGARLVVEDAGPGVPEDERERIFEPFHRAESHREGTDGGVGLGLSLVREIARSHGGTCVVEAREPVGSRFVVTLSSGS